MGLITGLLTLPLAPVRGVVWIADQVRTVAEGEYAGRDTIYERLAEIERARDAGEISAEESAELEERIIEELQETYGEGY